jgi:hypothetical protein
VVLLESGVVAEETRRAVKQLAYEHPDWIPILRAACAQAEKSEPYGGRFAGRWVLQEVKAQTGNDEWKPGLRRLVAYGLIDKAGESTRGGRRAYYRMPHRAEVERALRELPRQGI